MGCTKSAHKDTQSPTPQSNTPVPALVMVDFSDKLSMASLPNVDAIYHPSTDTPDHQDCLATIIHCSQADIDALFTAAETTNTWLQQRWGTWITTCRALGRPLLIISHTTIPDCLWSEFYRCGVSEVIEECSTPTLLVHPIFQTFVLELPQVVQSARQHHVVIVGISGATRAGKTSVTRNITALREGKVKTVHQDEYFDRFRIGHRLQGNWDEPAAVNGLQFLQAVLDAIREAVEGGGGLVLVEGFLAFQDAAVWPLFDLKVWLDMGKEECRRRRTRDYKTEIPTFDEWIWPAHEQYKAQLHREKKWEQMVLFDSLTEKETLANLVNDKIVEVEQKQ